MLTTTCNDMEESCRTKTESFGTVLYSSQNQKRLFWSRKKCRWFFCYQIFVLYFCWVDDLPAKNRRLEKIRQSGGWQNRRECQFQQEQRRCRRRHCDRCWARPNRKATVVQHDHRDVPRAGTAGVDTAATPLTCTTPDPTWPDLMKTREEGRRKKNIIYRDVDSPVGSIKHTNNNT